MIDCRLWSQNAVGAAEHHVLTNTALFWLAFFVYFKHRENIRLYYNDFP